MLLPDDVQLLTSPSLPPGYTMQVGMPAVHTYIYLRLASGLSPKTSTQVAPIAANTWYGVYITGPSGETVAMGRIISDSGWFFLISDMATLPEHQKRGLGAAILQELMVRIKHHTRDIEGAPAIVLFGDPPGRRLYRKFGFEDIPSSFSQGMWLPFKREGNVMSLPGYGRQTSTAEEVVEA